MTSSKAWKVTLDVRREGFSTQSIAFEGGQLVIGRDDDCEVLLDSQFVSRRHAEVVRESDFYKVRDLDSRNGTYLNNKRMEANRLYDFGAGDSLRIDEFTLSLTFANRAAATVARALLEDDQLYVDTHTSEIWIGERRLDVRESQVIKLLSFLFSGHGRICSRDEIGAEVWGEGGYSSNDVYNLVYRARCILEKAPEKPQYLLSAPRLGYRLLERPWNH